MSGSMWRSAAGVAMIAALVAGTGCGEDFAPYWRIDKLRVMAVRALPITSRPGQPARLEALVYQPDPAAEVTYKWEWCPFQTSSANKYACPFTREELGELVRQGAEQSGQPLPAGFDIALVLPDFDLGSGPTAELPYPAEIFGDEERVEVVRGLCQLAQAGLASAAEEIVGAVSVPSCDAGYEVSVRVTVTSGDEEIVANKVLLLWTGDEQINENPEPTGVEIRVKNTGDIAKVASRLPWVPPATTPVNARWVPLSEDEPLPVLVGVPYELRTTLSDGSVQLWQPRAPQGSDLELLPPEREALTFRWFTTLGDLSDSSRLYKDGLNSLDEASVTDLSLPSNNSPDADPDGDGLPTRSDPCPYFPTDDRAGEDCTVRLWGVVRDGRRGLGWTSRAVKIIGHVND